MHSGQTNGSAGAETRTDGLSPDPPSLDAFDERGSAAGTRSDSPPSFDDVDAPEPDESMVTLLAWRAPAGLFPAAASSAAEAGRGGGSSGPSSAAGAGGGSAATGTAIACGSGTGGNEGSAPKPKPPSVNSSSPLSLLSGG